jgi:hypothetical protein
MDRWLKMESLKKKENVKKDQLHKKETDGAISSYFRYQRQIVKEMSMC